MHHVVADSFSWHLSILCSTGEQHKSLCTSVRPASVPDKGLIMELMQPRKFFSDHSSWWRDSSDPLLDRSAIQSSFAPARQYNFMNNAWLNLESSVPHLVNSPDVKGSLGC